MKSFHKIFVALQDRGECDHCPDSVRTNQVTSKIYGEFSQESIGAGKRCSIICNVPNEMQFQATANPRGL